ncbi:MAG: response regulator [Patescibacteria group bacterium]|nr:response regulator [Patescibacteria group bacterium]
MPSHHTILIIDDDKLILNTLRRQFETWGTNVIAAATPAEAKHQLEQGTPDLVVLDLLLTEADGSSGVLDFMQSQDRLRGVPVIALTNLDKPELKQMLLSEGRVKEYLIKGSLNLDELFKKVWGYLEPGK